MRRLAFTAFVALHFSVPVHGQQDTSRLLVDTTREVGAWNSARVMGLMQRATIRRAQPLADSALRNYRATAEGFVYFFLDRRDNDERTLVRVNQIGLELYWRQPGIARQRIAGMRDASPLPNTMRYHIDHLTMVQNGFGDIIRVGDGDEVRDVIHPASTRGPTIYDYRLADSTDLRLANAPTSIRVYEVQVRPKHTDRPGFVGSIFIDRETADIIRMTFTFTPSSYVDRRLDYINLSLDNGLWENRYWLPNEQTVEIRRQIPELDFAAGSVIRGHMQVTNYELNATIPDSIFRQGRAVVSASPSELASYPFEQGIFDDVSNQGLSQTSDAKALRQEAAELIGSHLLSGLPDVRLHYPDVSSLIRYNRAEGWFLGLGVTRSSGPPWRMDGDVGYAFGSKRGSAAARVTYQPTATAVSLGGYTHALQDMGPVRGTPGVTNSLSSLIAGRDYLDPWYATGVSLRAERPVHEFRIAADVSVEQMRQAHQTQSHALFDSNSHFRAIRAIDEGVDRGMTLSLERTVPTAGMLAWGGSLSLRVADFAADSASVPDGAYASPALRTDIFFRTSSHVREVHLMLAASAATSGTPATRLFNMGGPGTLPGYRYRSLVGRSGAVAYGEFTQRVRYPWLGLRGVAAIGATSATPLTTATQSWNVDTSGGARASLGAGVSLFWDILHVDAVRGVSRGGRWTLDISFNRSLADIS